MKQLMLISGTSVPEVVTKKINGATFKIVPYVISDNNGNYEWTEILVRPSGYTYEGLVKAIINIHYTPDEMFAIMNNYLLDPENEKYKDEFIAMQSVRKSAKEYAKNHFNID